MLIGESYIGEGAEAAHVNTVFGERSGPAGRGQAGHLRDILCSDRDHPMYCSSSNQKLRCPATGDSG